MIQTAFTRLMGVDHPVVSAGMGARNTDGELVGRVSEAGGLGVIGASFLDAHEVAEMIKRAREITSNPFGVNLLLFSNEHLLEGVLGANPSVLSTAWPRADQDLKSIFAKAHDRGIKVMHMVPTLDDAKKSAEAGADVIVAQGTEGGGHIGPDGHDGHRASSGQGRRTAAGAGSGWNCRRSRTRRGAGARRAGCVTRDPFLRHHRVPVSEIGRAHV